MSRFETLDLNFENNKAIIIIVFSIPREQRSLSMWIKCVYLKSMKKLFMASDGSKKAQQRPKSLYHDDDNDAT